MPNAFLIFTVFANKTTSEMGASAVPKIWEEKLQ
jgi:hypothetical protein